jgi:hypothetical protein
VVEGARPILPDISQGFPGYFYDRLGGSNISWISADYSVPTNPINSGGTDFLFPAIEPDDLSQILQPVLQWNQSGFGNEWTVAGWICCVRGNTHHGTMVGVSVGDTISGYVYPYGTNNWYIGINVNGGFVTDLSATSGATFNAAFGGVLEVYNINNCGQLPSTGFEYFQNIAVYQAGVQITPSWTAVVNNGLSPNCNVSVYPNVTSTEGAIYWTYD